MTDRQTNVTDIIIVPNKSKFIYIYKWSIGVAQHIFDFQLIAHAHSTVQFSVQ